MINILLVDDRTLLCEVLKTWLDVEQDMRVVGLAHNGREAIEAVEKLHPDIVLMDIDMPEMDGLEATEIISQRFPQVKVIFLSGHDDEAKLRKSLQTGAKGYLFKDTTAEELVKKIRSVERNANPLEPAQLDDFLTAWQVKLEETIATYRSKFEDILEERETSIDTQYIERLQQLEHRLNDIDKSDRARASQIENLEQKYQSDWKAIRQEVINLDGHLKRQTKDLRQDLDSKLSLSLDDWSRQRAALQEWAVQRDEMRPSPEDYEAKHRQELMATVDPLLASSRDMERQLQKMGTWLKICGLFTLISLAVSGYLLISRAVSLDSFTPPPEELID